MDANQPIDYFDLMQTQPHLFRGKGVPFEIITDREQIQAWEAARRIELDDQHAPREWSKIGVILDDPYIVVLRDLVRFPDGSLGGYFRVINRADLRGGQGAVVLPWDEGKIILLYQYRHATRQWHYEIPRGFGEPGVSAEENARKELQEEINGTAAELIDLGAYHNNTGSEGNQVELFFARMESVGEPASQEGIRRLEWVSVSRLEEMIAGGKITDGFTIAAYTRCKLRGLI